MNDPGLDDPIENSANRVEGEIEGPEKPEDVQKEEEQAFLDPRYSTSPCLSQQQINNVFSRWWFASTAFPLLAVGSPSALIPKMS